MKVFKILAVVLGVLAVALAGITGYAFSMSSDVIASITLGAFVVSSISSAVLVQYYMYEKKISLKYKSFQTY